MLAQKITSHVADAQARLLSQYKGAPRINALVGALAGGAQDIEDALYALVAGRQLDQAVGAQLDALGTLIGFARSGLEDGPYRVLLRGTIAQQHSDTTAGTLNTIASLLYQAAAVFLQTPTSPSHARTRAPAQVTLAVGSPQTPPSLYETVRGMLQGALAAGVPLVSVTQFQASKAFAMAGPQAWVGGFGDANDPSKGAPFGTLIYSNPAQ